MISDTTRQKAIEMLHQLESSKLDVYLLPFGNDSEQRKVRVVAERNAKWYRNFCARFPSGRKKPRNRKAFDTLIKRQLTIRALNEIINGRCLTIYAQRLIDFIEETPSKFDLYFDVNEIPGFGKENKNGTNTN